MLGYSTKTFVNKKRRTYDCESIIGADTDESGVFLKHFCIFLGKLNLSGFDYIRHKLS